MLPLLGSHPEHLNPRDNLSISSMKLFLLRVYFISSETREPDRQDGGQVECVCLWWFWLILQRLLTAQLVWDCRRSGATMWLSSKILTEPPQQTHAEDLRGVKRRYYCSAHFFFYPRNMKRITSCIPHIPDIFQEESRRALQIVNVVVGDFRHDGERLSTVPRQMTTDQTTENV